MTEVATILLAAGLSRRMGAKNKLLLPVGEHPMIAHMVRTYKAATDGPVLVITGHDHQAVTAALEGSGAQILFNPDFAKGQATSVACGLRAAPAADTLLIGLGDQPLLRPADISALLAAHRETDPSRISIPAIGPDRGNPIVVPARLIPRLLADPRAPGCKSFTRTQTDHVLFHALPAPGFYRDVDTPDDYAQLLELAS